MDSGEIKVHLFCCPNPDSIHGLSGYYFQYLMINGMRLWQVTTYHNLKDGTEEAQYTWRMERREKEFVMMDDPSDSFVQVLLQYQYVKPIYHVRMCRGCLAKGLEWHPNVGPDV